MIKKQYPSCRAWSCRRRFSAASRRLPEDTVAIGLIDPEGSLADTEAQIGDIIVNVNGTGSSGIGRFVAGGKAGDPVTLGLVRILEDGTAYEFEVTGTVMLFAD